jgi:hypothetical protein
MNRSARIVLLALGSATPALAYPDEPPADGEQESTVTVTETEGGPG